MYSILNDPEAGGQTWPADVRVVAGVNTNGPHEQEVIEEGAFRFLPIGAGLVPPQIYLVVPAYGTPRGGEMVTVLGRGFDYNDGLPDSVTVEFIISSHPDVGAVTLFGIEPEVSPDGHQIQVMTPQVSALPLSENAIADVRVTNVRIGEGVNTDTKTDAFVFLAEDPMPEITAISPTSGPIDGGTVMTIFGHGFSQPLLVGFFYGDFFLEAQVIEVNDDTGLNDYDTIICVTPDASQYGLEPPLQVEVIVRNVLSGNESNSMFFNYVDTLFISGNNPSEGQRGAEVIIYGGGFEDPLQVEFLGGPDPPLDLIEQAVSGTELVVMFPLTSEVSCVDYDGTFKVTLIERPQEQGVGYVEGGNFTLLGNTPIVLSVDPSIVQETMGGYGVSPSGVTITGLRFCEDVQVYVDNYILDSAAVYRANSTTIEIILPAPNDFNIPGGFFSTTECTTDLGERGSRYVPTTVSIRVECVLGHCISDALLDLIYEPEDTTCRAAIPSVLVVEGNTDPWDFGDPLAGDSLTQVLTIRNDADPVGGDYMNVEWEITGTNADAWETDPLSPLAAPLGPGESTTIDVTYTSNGAQAEATLTVFGFGTDSSGAANYGPSTNSPITIQLQGNVP
jgi:hypothetical protein